MKTLPTLAATPATPSPLHQLPGDRPLTTRAAIGDALVQIGTGDSTRFAEFYAATHATVLRSVRRVLLCPQQAAEVTQEVYLQVWQQAARFDPARGPALGWMATMAHRRAVDRVRAARAALVRDDASAVDDTDGMFDPVWGDVVRRSDADVMRAAVDQLSTVQRDVLIMTYFRGHTTAEAAVLLSLPLGTVKTRVRVGLINLRRALVPGFVAPVRDRTAEDSAVVVLPARGVHRPLDQVA